MGDAAAISEHLEACFRLVHTERMDGVPILNDALEVRAVGTHAWNGFWLSILITPWFINVVLLPQEPDGEAISISTSRFRITRSGAWSRISCGPISPSASMNWPLEAWSR